MEENLEAILEKINTSIEERVNAAIETGIACIAQQYRQVDQANTTATTDPKAQVADLKSTVAQLRSQISSLSSDISAGNGDSAKTDTRKTQPREYGQKGPQEERIIWKTGLLWDNNWSRNKTASYRIAYKRRKPEGYKSWNKAQVVARHTAEMSRLE